MFYENLIICAVPIVREISKKITVYWKATLHSLVAIYQALVELSVLEERGSRSSEILVTLYQTTLCHIERTAVSLVIAVRPRFSYE
jgi:cyanate permease